MYGLYLFICLSKALALIFVRLAGPFSDCPQITILSLKCFLASQAESNCCTGHEHCSYPLDTMNIFLLDPGIPGVRSMGPGVCVSVSTDVLLT